MNFDYSDKTNAFDIVDMFEKALARYTGAPYAVAVDSCTNALFLCCKWFKVGLVTIPKKTYVSVPNSIIHAGGRVKFEDLDWEGIYQLKPYNIYDSARRFTSDMYFRDSYMCLSFTCKKHLKIGRGGAILTNNPTAVEWFKKARYHGRNGQLPAVEDSFDMLGYDMWMQPEQAARGLTQLMYLPKHAPDLSHEDYSDLSKFDIFNT